MVLVLVARDRSMCSLVVALKLLPFLVGYSLSIANGDDMHICEIFSSVESNVYFPFMGNFTLVIIS